MRELNITRSALNLTPKTFLCMRGNHILDKGQDDTLGVSSPQCWAAAVKQASDTHSPGHWGGRGGGLAGRNRVHEHHSRRGDDYHNELRRNRSWRKGKRRADMREGDCGSGELVVLREMDCLFFVLAVIITGDFILKCCDRGFCVKMTPLFRK